MSFAFRFHLGCFTCISSQSVDKLKSNNINIYYIIIYSQTLDIFIPINNIHNSYFLSTKYRCLGRHVTRIRVDVLSRLSCFLTIFAKYRFSVEFKICLNDTGTFLECVFHVFHFFIFGFFFTYLPANLVNTLNHARISDWFLDTRNSYSVMDEQTEHCTIKPLYLRFLDTEKFYLMDQ